MDDNVPNAPPLWLSILYQALGFLAFALALVPTLLVRAVLHISPRTRPYPTWSLRRDLAVAAGRLFLACTTYAALPRQPGRGAWRAAPLVQRAAGHGTRVRLAEAPPLAAAWLVGVATAGGGVVVPEPVPCFWTFCERKGVSAGDERAEAGERVILYVAGG